MTCPVSVQIGLFGTFNDLIGLHVVDAHTRVLADGTEVFVAEHLRWNRGRKSRGTTSPRAAPPSQGQQSLFQSPPVEPKAELAWWKKAQQLGLWSSDADCSTV